MLFHFETHVTNRSCPIPSYKATNLIQAAMEYLGCREVRELNRLCATPQTLRRLQGFLKGVQVAVPGNRTKRVGNLVPRAGIEEFSKDGRMITVAVSVSG